MMQAEIIQSAGNTMMTDTDLIMQSRSQPMDPICFPFPRFSTTLVENFSGTTDSIDPRFFTSHFNYNPIFSTSEASNCVSVLVRDTVDFCLTEEIFSPEAPKMLSDSTSGTQNVSKISLAALRANFSQKTRQILVSYDGKNRKFIALPAHFSLETMLNLLLSLINTPFFNHSLNMEKNAHFFLLGKIPSAPHQSVQPEPVANIMTHFSELSDPRLEHKKDHKLLDIVVIAICAVVSGANHWTNVETFGRSKFNWLQSFLELPAGIPSHDTFRRVFMLLDPEEFRKCFLSWVESVSQVTNGEIIAIDGKQLRRSHNKKLGEKAIHMVSAWATQNELVLGQVKVDDKSNEITAIPKLLKMLEISGCIITIDAMGCQKDIAQQIINQKGDYVLSLKKNHKTLFLEVENLFANLISNKIQFDYHQTKEKSHGRLETRQCWTVQLTDLSEPLYKSNEWKNLKTIVMIKSKRVLNGKEENKTRYFISSLDCGAKKHLQTVRSHWKIENSLHWVLDVGFREDESRLRTGHGPQNFAMLRHFALNLLKQETSSSEGIQSRRLEAGWNENYLVKVLSL